MASRNVCSDDDCRHHEGLAQCYCGWPRGERLEDDVGHFTFNGDTWEEK